MKVPTTQYKVVPVLEGFEKFPGKELVIEIEIRHVPLSTLQDIFQDDLVGGSLPVAKQYEDLLYKKTGIKIDTTKLDFFIGLYSDN